MHGVIVEMSNLGYGVLIRPSRVIVDSYFFKLVPQVAPVEVWLKIA